VDRIPRWRLALVASALVVLGALGAGLVLATDTATPPAASEAIGLGAFLDPGPLPGDADATAAERLGHRAGRLLHRLQRLVHSKPPSICPTRAS